MLRVLPMTRNQTSSRATAKITSNQSTTLEADDIFYFQIGMDNTVVGAGLAERMQTTEFKKSVGLLKTCQDPAATFETYRSSAVPCREEQHAEIYFRLNMEEGVDKLVKTLYRGRDLSTHPKALELTDIISKHTELAYKVCVVKQPLTVEVETQVLLSKKPTFLCMEVLIQPVFKRLLNNLPTTSGGCTTFRTEVLKTKRAKSTSRIKTSPAAKKTKYVPPSRSEPTTYPHRGQGEISQYTKKPICKRGRKSGSKVKEDGTVQAPAGSMRPTPMKVSNSVNLISPGGFVQNTCDYCSVKDGELLALRQELREVTSAKNAAEAELATCMRDYEKDRNAFALHEDRLFSELKARKTFIKTVIMITKSTHGDLNDNEVYTEFERFRSVRMSDQGN